MFLEVILSLVTVAVFSLFAIRPTLLTIANLVSEINEKKVISQKLDQKISNISTAQKNVSSHQTQIDILNSSIPDKPFPEEYIRQIEALVTKNGVSLEQIRSEEIPLIGEKNLEFVIPDQEIISNLPESAETIFFSLTVTGNYSNLKSFLLELENTRRPLIIDSYVWDASQLVSSNPLILTINATLPYLK